MSEVSAGAVAVGPGASSAGSWAALAARRARRRSYAGRGTFVVLAVVITACTWPITSVLAAPGIDPSWAVGLSLAVARGLAFGRQVVFTYGPLGPFAVPVAVTPGTLLLGVAGAAAMQLALVTLVLRALRRQCPLLIAALLTLVCVSIISAVDLPALDDIAFGLVAFALSQPDARMLRATRTLALAGGALAGLSLLVIFSDGIGVAAIVAAGLLGGTSRPRHLALGAISFVVTITLAWIALGQPLGALPDYVVNGLSIVQGYVDAMGQNLLGVTGEWQLAAVIVSAAAFAAAAWFSLADAPLRRRNALAGSVLLVHYFIAREMFVRYTAGHAAVMALLLAVPLLIPWRRGQRVTGFAMATGLAAASMAVLGVYGYAVGVVVDPSGREKSFAFDIKTVISPQNAIALGTANIRDGDAVPAAIVGRLTNHCVSVDTEISVIFAYPQWRWCPIGAMQSYVAYTTRLDNLDAAAYANARSGPDRVLRQVNSTIDERNPIWDSPAAMLSLLCHFKEIYAAGQWQALARIPDRCGEPRPLATLHSDSLDVVQFPAPPRRAVLVAQVYGLQLHHRERLETLFARAAERTIVVNGAATWRVPPDTVTDGLILDVPAYADYAAPFSFNLATNSIEAEVNGIPVPITVKLWSVPIRRGYPASPSSQRPASAHRAATKRPAVSADDRHGRA